ncbi:MAG: choice-of-anchor Q domain-containing protein [Pyrinomonadaceae bacterium]
MNAKLTTITWVIAAMAVGPLCASAAIRTVDRTDDFGGLPSPGEYACTAAAGDCTLRGAIMNASAGDTVNFAPSTYGHTITIPAGGAGIPITQNNLLIQGPGSDQMTITMAGQGDNGGIFGLSAGVTGVRINFLNLANTALTIQSSNVINLGTNSSLTLDSDSFIGNTGNSTVKAVGATVVITNAVFSGNAMAVDVQSNGNATINSSLFRSNSGGAVSCLSGTLNVQNSLFLSNTSPGNGAGINNGACSATILNTTFSGNSANGSGGAFYAGGSGSNFFRHLTISGNSAKISGGGVFDSGSAANVANSIVSGNTAPSVPDTNLSGSHNIIGPNAGLYALGNYGGPTQTYALMCNSPARDAGSNALSTDAQGNPLTIDARGPGFARNVGGTVDIGAVEMVTKPVSNTSDSDSTLGSLRNAIANANPGDELCFDAAFFSTPRVITMSGGNLTVDKSLIISGPGQNLLTLDAGLASRHFYFSFQAPSVVLSGMTLTNGQPNISDPDPSHGGSIDVGGFTSNGSGAGVTLQNVTITNSTAILGGGIYSLGNVNVIDSTLSGNTAPQGGGGGIYSETFKTLTVLRSTFSGNSAVDGGGIENLGTLTVTDSTFDSNAAKWPPGFGGSSPRGGGIFNVGTATVSGSTLISNTAQQGGAVFNYYYTSLSNSTFSNNGALDLVGGNVWGGAICSCGPYTGSISGTIDAANITVAGNHSAGDGGGAYLWQDANNTGYINTVNSIYALNTAASGSGPDVHGNMFSYGNNIIGNNNAVGFFGNSPVPTGNQLGTPASPIDPHLAPISNYGGPTKTFALLSNSTALNAGRSDFVLATDQRGETRPRESVGDIGAYERSVTINQSTLPAAHQTVAYNQQLTANRLTSFADRVSAPAAPSTWALAPAGGESLPPGITLSSGGLLSGTPTTLGTYNFTVKAIDTDGMAGAQRLTITVLGPTAAEVGMSGRVITPFGNGLRGARVIATRADGKTVTAITNAFGYYAIDGITAGETLVVNVGARGYRFSPRIVTLADNLTDFDLVVSP